MWRGCIFQIDLEDNSENWKENKGFHVLLVFSFTTSCWDICIFLSPSTSNLPSITSEQKLKNSLTLWFKYWPNHKFTNSNSLKILPCQQFNKQALFPLTNSQLRIHYSTNEIIVMCHTHKTLWILIDLQFQGTPQKKNESNIKEYLLTLRSSIQWDFRVIWFKSHNC